MGVALSDSESDVRIVLVFHPTAVACSRGHLTPFRVFLKIEVQVSLPLLSFWLRLLLLFLRVARFPIHPHPLESIDNFSKICLHLWWGSCALEIFSCRHADGAAAAAAVEIR